MKLSIITINYNNAEGLRKTLASVAAQTYPNIEHIIVDGGSTDGSVEVIEAYASGVACTASGCGIKDAVSAADAAVNSQPAKGAQLREATQLASGTLPAHSAHHQILWVSEPDKGIYNAMNKGIEIALGKRVVNDDHTSSPLASSLSPLASNEYIQILNSGDILAAPDVTERMFQAMGYGQWAIDNETNASRLSPLASRLENCPAIFYGNMIKVNAAGKVVGKSGYTEYSLRQFYSSTLNHDCAYIRRDLFEEYGLYDEQLKIVSDWKWYMQAIGLGRVKPEYVDIDVTPQELQDKLFSCGFEVEEIIYLGEKINRVVVGEVKALTPHPDSDHMQICVVDCGEEYGRDLQIVTGAPNVYVGMKTPCALDGSTVVESDPRQLEKNPDAVKKIKKGKLRGVESCGMLCSGEELGINDDYYDGAEVNGPEVEERAFARLRIKLDLPRVPEVFVGREEASPTARKRRLQRERNANLAGPFLRPAHRVGDGRYLVVPLAVETSPFTALHLRTRMVAPGVVARHLLAPLSHHRRGVRTARCRDNGANKTSVERISRIRLSIECFSCCHGFLPSVDFANILLRQIPCFQQEMHIKYETPPIKYTTTM